MRSPWFPALLTLFVGAALSACSDSKDRTGARTGEWMQVIEVVRDLVSDPPEWTVVRSEEGMEPAVGVICPAMRHGLDGADMPSILLPPPSEIRFSLGDFDEPRFLKMRAGVDISVVKMLGNANPEGVFGFEVLVNGDSVHRSEVRLHFTLEDPGSEWTDVGGPGGIPVSSGAEITLRTFAMGPDGREVVPPKAAAVGFGGMRLVRSIRVPRTRPSPEAPNLVLMVMDTLRRDRLSAYGYSRDTSPNLETLASRGVLFENAYSTASWTWPSTASILTGLQPEEHGVRDSSSCYLAYDLTTVAEALQRAGVTTAAWSGNPLITASRGFDQGFESFHDDREDLRKAGAFFSEAQQWLREHRDTRFFLYLHLIEPHRPFAPLPEGGELLAPGLGEEATREGERIGNLVSFHPPWDDAGNSLLDTVTTKEQRDRISRLYDACVWSGDRWLGELMRTLDELELTEETVVVFTTDHGEEIFERGGLGHGKRLYGELVHIPLVIAGPGVPRGVRISSVVSNRWTGPFLASVAGLPLGNDFDREGFFDPEAPDRVVLFSTEHGYWKGFRRTPLMGMRSGQHVVQLAPKAGPWGTTDDPPPGGDMMLFDVVADPGETRDLSGEAPDLARRLRADLERRFGRLQLQSVARSQGKGAGTAALLERIGYAGQ